MEQATGFGFTCGEVYEIREVAESPNVAPAIGEFGDRSDEVWIEVGGAVPLFDGGSQDVDGIPVKFVDLVVAQMEVKAGAHFGVEVCDLFGGWEKVKPIAIANLEEGLAEQIDQSVGQAEGG